jgi:hypothetical protein
LFCMEVICVFYVPRCAVSLSCIILWVPVLEHNITVCHGNSACPSYLSSCVLILLLNTSVPFCMYANLLYPTGMNCAAACLHAPAIFCLSSTTSLKQYAGCIPFLPLSQSTGSLLLPLLQTCNLGSVSVLCLEVISAFLTGGWTHLFLLLLKILYIPYFCSVNAVSMEWRLFHSVLLDFFMTWVSGFAVVSSNVL